MTTSFSTIKSLAKIIPIGGLVLAFTCSPVRAQSSLSGTYNCVSVEINGKAHPCKAPSIEMNSDGSYQILAERGTYEILKGHWLALSTSKNHGRARLDGSHEIIFEFQSSGKREQNHLSPQIPAPPAWVSS